MAKENNIGKVAAIGGAALMTFIFLRKGNNFFNTPPIEQQLNIVNGQMITEMVGEKNFNTGDKTITLAELMDLVVKEKVRVIIIFRFNDQPEKAPFIQESVQKLLSVGAVVRTKVFFRATTESLSFEEIDELLGLIIFSNSGNLNIFVREGNNVFVPIEEDGEISEMLIDNTVLSRIITRETPTSIMINVEGRADRNFAKEVESLVVQDKNQSTTLNVRDI